MGYLTTHVLDTASGKPGANIAIDLFQIAQNPKLVKSLITNLDGRTEQNLLDENEFSTGTWELVFHVGDYFSRKSVNVDMPPFLDEITLRFTMASDDHYHVPLLVSPWSYSTYRGS